ncbi:MAG: HD domain-containing protein [Candidatus Omnitrophota bacterium]|nr:HD domain-containing protein [Candidatus Omnitrophota bacterium]
MSIDYKRELEQAARTMILIHNPATLIRMIVRMIVRKVKLRHAAILLFDKKRNSYVLTISRGERGLRIPAGFARVDSDSALISLFTQYAGKAESLKKSAMVCEDIDKMLWKNTLIRNEDKEQELLTKVSNEMRIFESVACIPTYFQNHLLGILLLGEKISTEKFTQEELDFFAALASDVSMAISNAQLFQELQDELKANKDLFLRTTIALAAAIEAKDIYTRGHTERVTKLSLVIAQKLTNSRIYTLPENFLENLHIGSLLHDIGKIGIPETILNKPGKLTEEEFAVIREHTLKGAAILQPIKEMEECLAAVKYHHERYDGNGYPEGLVGEKIPLIAAIISVADAFDAMIIDRPYRKARSRVEAIEEIKRCSGSQFNPVVANCLLELAREGRV